MNIYRYVIVLFFCFCFFSTKTNATSDEIEQQVSKPILTPKPRIGLNNEFSVFFTLMAVMSFVMSVSFFTTLWEDDVRKKLLAMRKEETTESEATIVRFLPVNLVWFVSDMVLVLAYWFRVGFFYDYGPFSWEITIGVLFLSSVIFNRYWADWFFGLYQNDKPMQSVIVGGGLLILFIAATLLCGFFSIFFTTELMTAGVRVTSSVLFFVTAGLKLVILIWYVFVLYPTMTKLSAGAYESKRK